MRSDISIQSLQRHPSSVPTICGKIYSAKASLAYDGVYQVSGIAFHQGPLLSKNLVLGHRAKNKRTMPHTGQPRPFFWIIWQGTFFSQFYGKEIPEEGE